MNQERFDQAPRNIYEDGSSIDIIKLFKSIISKLWIILLVGVVGAAAGYIISESTYVRQYSASTTLAFMQTQYVRVTDYSETGEADTYVQEHTTFYTQDVVARYQRLLTGDVMVGKIKTALDAQGLATVYSEGFIRNSLNISGVEGLPGFFVISVTSIDSGYCERALKIVMNEFESYINGFDNTISISVINEPTAPGVSNDSGSIANAMYGFIIGAALVVLIIFFTVIVSDTVQNMDNLKAITGTKVLGAVPIIEKPNGLFMKKKVPSGSLLITDEQKVSFSFVESFKDRKSVV